MKSWLYTLERSVAWLIKKFIKWSINVKLEETEEKYQLLLDSQLFRGGFQDLSLPEKQFIEDFIDNKPNSLANSIIMEIEKKIPQNYIDKIGGNIVDKALRSFCITLIKVKIFLYN